MKNIKVGNLAPGGHDGNSRLPRFCPHGINIRQYACPQCDPKSMPEKSGVIYLPGIMNLSRTRLAELLASPISAKTVIDESQPPEKILLQPNRVQLETTEARIEELRTLIKESKDVLRGLGKVLMNRRRNPDDILDKSTREKFKREEHQKLTEYESEKRKLHKLLKQLRTENYELRPAMKQVPIILEEVFFLPDEPEFLPPGYDYGVQAYLQSVLSYDSEAEVMKKFWNAWIEFENEIVLQAAMWNLIELPAEASKVTSIAAQDANQAEQDAMDYSEEEALILMTGGASIGGSIHGTNRPGEYGLKSFDKIKPLTENVPAEYGGDRSDVDPDERESDDFLD
jgi:hypothetical protein